MQQRLSLALQLDGFGSDSVRLVRDLRRDAQQPVQFLLFSATFNERIKSYALRVTADDGKEEVNQVWPAARELSCALSVLGICIIWPLSIMIITEGDATHAGVCAQRGPLTGCHQAVSSGEHTSDLRLCHSTARPSCLLCPETACPNAGLPESMLRHAEHRRSAPRP